MTIDHADALEKEWIWSTKPYPISLSLKNIQEILDVKKSMGHDCFNMAVRTIACKEFLLFLDDKFRHMDLQFWTISDFYREPHRRAKLNVKQLAKLFECWPGMEYNILHCNILLLPYSFIGHFTLFVLDMSARSVSILDLMPIPYETKGHPTTHYVHKIGNIAINIGLAMEIANLTWNDNIYYWHRKVPVVPKTHDWHVTGFYVLDFMRSWDGKQLSSICTDENKLRAEFFLTY